MTSAIFGIEYAARIRGLVIVTYASLPTARAVSCWYTVGFADWLFVGQLLRRNSRQPSTHFSIFFNKRSA
jgi:hypothetical protein